MSWLAGDARNLLLTYNGDEESCLPLVDAMANGEIDDVDERNVEAEESHDVADADEQEPEVLQQREVHHLLQCVLAALRHTQVAPGLKHIQPSRTEQDMVARALHKHRKVYCFFMSVPRGQCFRLYCCKGSHSAINYVPLNTVLTGVADTHPALSFEVRRLAGDGGNAGDVAFHVWLRLVLGYVEDTATVENVLPVQGARQVFLGHTQRVEDQIRVVGAGEVVRG